ncbi:MAG: ABC transporter permease [Clostridia bacterium]|nr:ABC transporter permease [Clostridia bacterium]
MKSRIIALPYYVWMVIFTLVPLILVGIFAFTDSETGAFTVSNLLEISKYLPTLLRSVLYAVVTTVVCLILGFPAAYIISRLPEEKQSTVLMLLMLPMWINFILRTYAWMNILDANGFINQILMFFGLKPIKMLNTSAAVILGMIYNNLPFMILPLYSIMTKIDKSVIEAAQDLGCSDSNVIRKVIIPLAIPGISTGITMVFVPSVSTFIISRMLSGSTIGLIGDLIEQEFLGLNYDPYVGSALSLVLMVIVLVIIGIFNQFGGEDAVV